MIERHFCMAVDCDDYADKRYADFCHRHRHMYDPKDYLPIDPATFTPGHPDCEGE